MTGTGQPAVTGDLPRLLYIGDVPVEPTVAGAALVYRLLDGYPEGRLTICQSDLPDPATSGKGLPGVPYCSLRVGSRRLRHSRLAGSYCAWMLQRAGAPARVKAVERQLSSTPEAVVTVAHGFSWVTAARFARRHAIPLHLIVHDDCVLTTGVAPPFRHYAEAMFERAYHQAVSRLCISPAMERHYRQRHGVAGSVLYPSRARDAQVFAAPPERVRQPGPSFTVAFAGSLGPGHRETMLEVVTFLERTGGRLELYGPRVDGAGTWTSSPAVDVRGFVPARELGSVLRSRADVLLLPMSFLPGDRRNMTLCFPSKLADYTAMGLPILVVGPGDGAGVVWARENHGAAAVVTDLGPQLATALERLRGDAEWRWELASGALGGGGLYFGHARAQQSFFSALATR